MNSKSATPTLITLYPVCLIISEANKGFYATAGGEYNGIVFTVGNAVCKGHDTDGEEGWNGLIDVVPVDLGSVNHHERPCQDQRRPRAVHWNGCCKGIKAMSTDSSSLYCVPASFQRSSRCSTGNQFIPSQCVCGLYRTRYKGRQMASWLNAGTSRLHSPCWGMTGSGSPMSAVQPSGTLYQR